jgi:hypothetical protein
VITPEQVLEMLEEHTNVLLYGPPGTGKSHLMKQVENLFTSKYAGSATSSKLVIDTAKEREAIQQVSAPGSHSRWVTFHQGYSYEDFIVGLRPAASNSADGVSSGLALEPKPGALLELAALAEHSHGLLLIDEINRGNTSRIFGEFITLMEADKRLGEDGTPLPTTITITLPYITEGQQVRVTDEVAIERDFQMPRHIYTLASMNSVDKSVAPIDAAIRRRFYLCHLRPSDLDWEEVAGTSVAQHFVAQLAVDVMTKVNRGIGLYLGPDYMLGQYYLPSKPTLGEMNESDAKSRFVSIWRHKVLPQILELFHSRPGVCEAILELGKHGNDSGLESVTPSNDEMDAGASTYIFNNEAAKSDAQIFSYLEKFSGASTPAVTP